MRKNDRNNRHCAVITGASSGIGAEFARKYAGMGYYLVISGRNEKALNELRDEIGKDRCTVITADLTKTKDCIDLYAKARIFEPDILINNAGIGVFGDFTQTSLSKELEMIDVNIKAMHILFKLFLKDFVRRDRGHILNVGSSAGFMPGPLMATYYSSKSYVIRQTQAVYTELKRRKSHVRVSVLCPGPVNTEFNRRTGITGSMKGITAERCVDYTISQMNAGKLTIVPDLKIQLLALAVKFAPVKLASYGAYIVQKRKKPLDN